MFYGECKDINFYKYGVHIFYTNDIVVWNYLPVNEEKTANSMPNIRSWWMPNIKVIFAGRLGEYKYCDMDAAIASAMQRVNEQQG